MPSYTRQTYRVPRFNIVTNFSGGTGTALNVRVNCQLESILINDSDATDVVYENGIRNVKFDLLDPLLTSSITAAGKTVTHAQLAALIRQVCLDRANDIPVIVPEVPNA